MLSVQQNKRTNLPIANRLRLASQQSLRSITTVEIRTCGPTTIFDNILYIVRFQFSGYICNIVNFHLVSL